MDDRSRRDLEFGVKNALIEKSQDYNDYFEQQRRDYGQAQRMLSKVAHLSHMVFWHLGRGDVAEAQIQYEYCKEAYDTLLKLNIPGMRSTMIENAAGQELVEAIIGLRLYPVLIGEQDISEISLPSEKDLDVTPQAWLAGLADCASELGKLTKTVVYYQIRAGKLAISREELYERRVAIGEGIRMYLNRYADSYPLILSAHPHPRQGYSSKRRLVAGAIQRGIEDLLDLPEMEEEEIEEGA